MVKKTLMGLIEYCKTKEMQVVVAKSAIHLYLEELKINIRNTDLQYILRDEKDFDHPESLLNRYIIHHLPTYLTEIFIDIRSHTENKIKQELSQSEGNSSSNSGANEEFTRRSRRGRGPENGTESHLERRITTEGSDLERGSTAVYPVSENESSNEESS